MATECIMMFLKQKDFPNNRRKPHAIDVNSYFFHRDIKLCASLPNNSGHPPQHTTHTLPKPKPARAILGNGERTESGMKSKFKTIPDSQCNWNIQERVFIWSRVFKGGNGDFRVYLFQLSQRCLKWEASYLLLQTPCSLTPPACPSASGNKFLSDLPSKKRPWTEIPGSAIHSNFSFTF